MSKYRLVNCRFCGKRMKLPEYTATLSTPRRKPVELPKDVCDKCLLEQVVRLAKPIGER